MMRLIDGDALADSLRESKNKLKEILDDERCEMEYRICEGQMITFIEAILRVNETPTIDAVPVRRGEWVGGELGYCTCCGHKGCASDIWDGVHGDMFCPNCGAEMRGGTNE